ncbi:hypothetical protein GP486_005817 [Trichoglossum hirsutum]|uniref:HAD superfamily hydrolase n=1 Tax=Trichoglossum hirsutum TaxID=265104 RepID=A0A9P8L8I2_9PEZI|nr:hypothetical protein GP486_005817 [Trichoglossum hirsutum]
MGKVTHLLFDCDNTLVLSEAIAFEACAEFANEILVEKKADYDELYTAKTLLDNFVGQNFRGMLIGLMKKHRFDVEEEELKFYVKEEENRVIANIKQRGKPCVGVNEELEKLYESGKYGMAIVSSSAFRRVKASIEKVGQDKYFPGDPIFSAATSLPVPTSKPDPAIYLHALEVLGKEASECIAIEDSRSGAKSAVDAGIHLIGYVGSYDTEKEQEDKREMLKELGARAVMTHWHEFPDCLAMIEELVAASNSRENGSATGKLC